VYATLQVFALGQPFGSPERTSYKCFTLNASNNSGSSSSGASDPIRWNEWISFPVKVRDLPRYSILAITFKAVVPNQDNSDNNSDGVIDFGGTVIPLFDDSGLLQSGRQKCFLWKDVPADPSMDTKTPYRPKALKGLSQFEQSLNSYNNKKLPRVDWLDKLTFKRIESIVGSFTSAKKGPASYTGGQASSNEVFLTIELPNFKFPVVFHEHYLKSQFDDFKVPVQIGADMDEKAPAFQLIHDPEAFLENPVEDKYLNIQRSGFAIDEKDLKPSV
jgi:phosphatidylinositol 3-kinase